MSFKEHAESDINTVFMDMNIFGEKHTIKDKEMLIIIDEYELIEREKKQRSIDSDDSLHYRKILFYVKKTEYGALPKIGRKVTFDSKEYTVTNAVDEKGIYSISLEAVNS